MEAEENLIKWMDKQSPERHMEICHKADELQKKNLGEEDGDGKSN